MCMKTTGSLYIEVHKTAETISCSCSLHRPPPCQRIGSSLEEMELCAQTGARGATPPAETTVKLYVCVCVCGVCLHLSQSAFRWRRSFKHGPNSCVCVWARTAWLGLLTLACWRFEDSAVLACGSPRPPLGREWILIIQSDLNLGRLWGCSPLPRDELILLFHERPPTGGKAEEGKPWCAT